MPASRRVAREITTALVLLAICCAPAQAQWTARITGAPGSTNPSFFSDIAVDPNTNRVWVAQARRVTLTAIDQSSTLVRTLPQDTLDIALTVDEFSHASFTSWFGFYYEGEYIAVTDSLELSQQISSFGPTSFDRALNAQGVPSVVISDDSGLSLASYDVPTGTWARQLVPLSGDSRPLFDSRPAIAFDHQNRPVIAYLSRNREATVLRQHPTLGWQTIAAEPMSVFFVGITLDILPDGNPVFAYISNNRELTLTKVDDQLVTTTQTIDQAASFFLRPDSLAINPVTGQPAIAYTDLDDSASQLKLATTTDGTSWTTETLPFNASFPSLAFNNDGETYIAASITTTIAGEDRRSIALISQDTSLAIPGDFNHDASLNPPDLDLLGQAFNTTDDLDTFDITRDGVINADDALIWIRFYALTEPGDANLDQQIDLIDLSNLAANFGSPGTYAQGDFNLDQTIDLIDLSLLASNFGFDATTPTPPIPEPAASLLLLTLLTQRRPST
ncbi:MAG: hypothetical protein RIG82_04570 [Phycisphaeraceae bacterium]